jgi:hypothetical protein
MTFRQQPKRGGKVFDTEKQENRNCFPGKQEKVLEIYRSTDFFGIGG